MLLSVRFSEMQTFGCVNGRLATFSISLLMLLSGCKHYAQQIAHYSLKEPRQYAYYRDLATRNKRLEHLAKEEWERVSAGSAQPLTSSFERGFREGYLEFLRYGSQPPQVLPPRDLWSTRFRSGQGRLVIREWSSGFELGVCMASQSGLADSDFVPTISQQQHLLQAEDSIVESLEPTLLVHDEPTISRLPADELADQTEFDGTWYAEGHEAR